MKWLFVILMAMASISSILRIVLYAMVDPWLFVRLGFDALIVGTIGLIIWDSKQRT